jgi:L-lactate dehydrogenase complex protein LldE
MRVALFITCFNDTLFPDTGRAVVSLLERLGCQVDFPLEQTCCGQMHVNSGYAHEAAPLLARFERVFSDADVVVSPSASCVAHVREHVPGVRALELTEFLVDELGVVDVGAEECCGFGGTFAVKNADTSMAMLSDKLRHVLDTRAEVCTAADTSCLMQIGGALRRQRAGVRTMHLAEILVAQECVFRWPRVRGWGMLSCGATWARRRR